MKKCTYCEKEATGGGTKTKTCDYHRGFIAGATRAYEYQGIRWQDAITKAEKLLIPWP